MSTSEKNHQYYAIYYTVYTYFWATLYVLIISSVQYILYRIVAYGLNRKYEELGAQFLKS